MLTEDQIAEVWDNRLSAEARSLYFADLASVYTTRKQWITGLSFFLSSGAAASLIGRSPVIVPVLLSITVALMSAYAVAVNLDSKIRTMSKLHCTWSQLNLDYANLWNHAYEHDSERRFDELQRRELELSELASMDAPNDEKRMSKWQKRVHRLRGLASA